MSMVASVVMVYGHGVVVMAVSFGDDGFHGFGSGMVGDVGLSFGRHCGLWLAWLASALAMARFPWAWVLLGFGLGGSVIA